MGECVFLFLLSVEQSFLMIAGVFLCMAKKYKVVFDKKACIGAAACAAVAPDYWEMQEDGKAHLIDSDEVEPGKEVLYLTKELMGKKLRDAVDAAESLSDERLDAALDDAREKNIEAAEVCPVQVIHVFDEETGEKLI